MQHERRELLASMKAAVDESRRGGAVSRAALLAGQAEQLLALMAARPGDGAKLIPAEAEPVE